MAFERRESTDDGGPTADAIEGALLHAEMHDTIRCFRKAYLKTK